jgi:hypothetical protein
MRIGNPVIPGTKLICKRYCPLKNSMNAVKYTFHYYVTIRNVQLFPIITYASKYMGTPCGDYLREIVQV